MSRRWLLAFLGIAALLCGLALLHPYPRQSLFGPTIRGKPWCVWEADVRRDMQAEEFEKSLSARVLRWLGAKHDPMEINELYNHADMIPLLLHLTEDSDPVIRKRAVSAFYWHKNLQDKSALPRLRARLEDADIRCRIEATMAVATIDPQERVLPVLLQILDEPDSEHRYEAMRAVTYLACADESAFAVMVRHAKDVNSGIRWEIMGDMFRHGKRGVPTLMLGLEDRDAAVRRAAVESLESLDIAGTNVKSAIPALERLLNDNDVAVREAAAEALATIEPKRFQHLKTERKID